MVILLLLTAMISCATIPHLNVEYRLPPKSDELKGKKVSLVFEDRRAVKDILGKGAQKDFKNFSGNISYSLARGKEKGFKIGLYTVIGINGTLKIGCHEISHSEINRIAKLLNW